jgi:3-isopropylmalate/(R)-2-methylmalate dehydratase small subunit
MRAFHRLSSLAASLPWADIDTDIIFPARFLLHTQKRGLGRFAFHDWADKVGFAFGPDAAARCEVVVAGSNFGCGSSREQAVWALDDLGVRCIIAPSFGEIFRGNCFKNGVLPIALPSPQIDSLHAAAAARERFDVDLESQRITVGDRAPVGFHIQLSQRDALLNGWDEIDMILRNDRAAIIAFEKARRIAAPWLVEMERITDG